MTLRTSDVAALSTLQGAGLTVHVVGNRLRIEPASLLTDALRAIVREHKGEILEQLATLAEVAQPSIAERPNHTALAPDWCRPYNHRFGYRRPSDGAWMCAVCCPLPGVVIHEILSEEVNA